MANELRDKGIAIANDAVASDNAGKHQDAVDKYCNAAEYLSTALKYEKNPVTKKTIQGKIVEYIERAEVLKKALSGQQGTPARGGGGGGKDDDDKDDDDDDDGQEPEPLTEEELKKAEAEMEEELAKLIGMDSVKRDMRKLCKQLSLDIKRRQENLNTLDAIRHMMFTGNPGVGKTTVSRLVAKLYKQLGVSSKDHVVEVQKGDLVAGFVNQTASKTAKKIKEAKGGILFVDEAYQLTQNLQRGQSDFSGEAIDEMMKNMLTTGRKSVTFVFAGYKKEMEEFVQYNAGLESRIKYRFHFDDYTVPELVQITNIKMKSKGYKMTGDAQSNLVSIIDTGTNAELRSKYNGRLIDNLMQWAADEMNTRLPTTASGDDLITLHKEDFQKAILRFKTARPPVKADPLLAGGRSVVDQLAMWDLAQYSEMFVRAGFRQHFDLLSLNSEKEIRALGIKNEADVRRATSLVERVKQQHREMSLEMDASYITPDMVDMRTWLDKRGLAEYAKLFEKHKVDFEILGDLMYEDIKEMGVVEIGPRRKIFRAITQWKDERDIKKADHIRSVMARREEQTPRDAAAERIAKIRSSLSL